MKFLDKRDRPVKVHTGKAVAKQLDGARRNNPGLTPAMSRHLVFTLNLGEAGAAYAPIFRSTDGGAARPSHTKKRKKPPGRGSRAAARRDHARRRRTPGGAFIPTSTA